MTRSTVSAEPERLYQYASRSQDLDQALISKEEGLERVLCRFEQHCTEPDFRVVAGPSASPVRDHGLKNQALGEEVRQVGRRFVLADSLQIGSSSRFSWFSTIRRHVSRINIPPTVRLLLTPIIGPPPWLISKIRPLTWIHRLAGSISPGDLPAEEPTGLSKSSDNAEPVDTSTSIPQSPVGGDGYSISKGAEFGMYTAGGFKGRLHNGVDLKPAGSSYDIYPIGPGRVVEADQHKKWTKDGHGRRIPATDDNGNVILTGYGNYVVLEHKRDNGETYYSRYAHLAGKPEFETGEKVNADTMLGEMGKTGTATGVHLHLEVYNSKAESKYYYRHKPHDIYDEEKGTTWEQKMLEGYLDPVPIIEGKEKWKWDTEWLKGTED